MSYYWVPVKSPRDIPGNAVEGGHENDGKTLFVGRVTYLEGDRLPAKVAPHYDHAYASFNGGEITVQDFEVLCGEGVAWMPCKNGQVPHNAIEGGSTSSGEKLYIGRANHDGGVTPGKIHPSHNCLYIPYGGEEHRYEEYEVLIKL